MIIEVEVFSKRGASLVYGCVGLEIHLLVFDGAPQPFDEHVVPPTAIAVHADVDRVGLQAVCEGLGGELRPLSVLNICGAPKRPRASSKASTQESASMVVASRKASTARVAQSMMATR